MHTTLQRASLGVETVANKLGQPVKPYVTHIGRFLLVVTFLEDAVRIVMQWNEQLNYLMMYRRLPAVVANVFLLYSVLAMLAGSGMALVRKQPSTALGLLTSVMVIQTFGYGLLSNAAFLMRNFALLGGLFVMVFDNDRPQHDRERRRVPLLPAMSETEKGTYLALAGRVLLICLTGSLLYNGLLEANSRFSYALRAAALIVAVVSSALVAIGFKARHSATVLVAVLSVFNILLNAWWTHIPGSAERDFMRYDFFQTLSIIGGFLLVVHGGPGAFSYDSYAKSKKTF